MKRPLNYITCKTITAGKTTKINGLACVNGLVGNQEDLPAIPKRQPIGNEIFLPMMNFVRSRMRDAAKPEMNMTRGTVATDVAGSCIVT